MPDGAEGEAHEPVWISEADVVDLIDLRDAIDAVEGGLRLQAAGQASTMEKTQVVWGDGHTLHAIGAVSEGHALAATKTWAHTAGGATPLLALWDVRNGRLLAIIEAFALGQMRTGSMSGVATRWLARPDAERLAVIGSGKQSLPQVASVAAVRPLREVLVHSPTPEHREALAARLRTARPDLDVQAVDTVLAATREADIVTTVTRARQPFLGPSMVKPGVHINAVGAISPERVELEPGLVAGASTVAVDSESAARRLAREVEAVELLVPIADLVDDPVARPDGVGITIFKAMGIGLADLAVGAAILERARAEQRGRPFAHPQRAAPRLWRTPT